MKTGKAGLRRRTVPALAAAVLVLLVWGAVRFLGTRRDAGRIPAIPAALPAKNKPLRDALGKADGLARRYPLKGKSVGDLGRLYLANFFFPEAGACFRLAMRLDPDEPRWPYHLAAVGEKMGRAEGTAEDLRRVIRLAPEYYQAALKLAALDFKNGDFDRAAAGYRSVAGMAEARPFVLQGLGRIEVLLRQWEPARRDLEEAVALAPRYGAAQRLLGTVYDNIGRADLRDIALDRAQTPEVFGPRDPWDEELDAYCFDPTEIVRRAGEGLKNKDPRRAYALCEKAVFIEPDSVDNLAAAAMALYNSESRSVALPFFKKITLLDPGNETAYFNMAGIYMDAGKPDLAGKVFEDIVRINPRLPGAYIGLGDIRFRRRELAEAESLYRKALDLDPRSARACYSLGNIAHEKGNSGAALGLYRRALELDDQLLDAHLSLGTLLVERGDLAGAGAQYRKAVELNPFQALARYNLANVYFRRGAFKEAEFQYLRTIDVAPEMAEAYLNLGALLVLTDRKGEARTRFEEALALARKQGDKDIETAILGAMAGKTP